MFLDTNFPPDSRVENEATSLIKAGHQVYLFSLSYKSESFEHKVYNDIDVYHYPASQLVYKLSALVYTFSFFRWLISSDIRQFIREVNPDVLHVHDMPLAKAVLTTNRQFNLPVLDLHEDRPEIMQFYGHMKRGIGKFLISVNSWKKAQTSLMRAADKLILVTEEAKNKYVDLGAVDEDKVTVVPNTIRPDIFLAYEEDSKVEQKLKGGVNILYLGDTGLRRGTDTAIKAMPAILEQIPTARLVLVGQNKEDVYLKSIASRLGVTAAVLFEGWQDVSKFPSYIASSDICISPLKRNAHHDTTYANKLFQYMALGKPVLVSDCPAQQKVVQDSACGLVHQADNPESFADNAVKLLTNTGLMQEMGENGLKAVRATWNWDVTGQGLLKLYEQFEA